MMVRLLALGMAAFLAALASGQTGSTVTVTLATVPAGLSISVDGDPAQTAPRALAWTAGSSHTISAHSPQGNAGTQYVFSAWSDGGAASHSITVPAFAATLTATYSTRFLLTRSASPAIAGSIVAIPPSADGYYAAGSVVQITASPLAGFSFSGYRGDASGTSPSQNITMAAPRAVAADFSLVAGIDQKTAVPPRLALRDIWGGIHVNVFGTTGLLAAGGVFGGDPQVVVGPGGDVYLVALDTWSSIWVNVLSGNELTFSGWRNAGGRLQGIPAVALAPNGSIYIGVRDEWNAYWLTSYNQTAGLGAWIYLGGTFSTDPAMAITPDGQIHLVGKDNWNALWTGRYSLSLGFQGWRFGGGIIKGKPSVAVGTDNVLYVAARDNWDGLWVGRIDNGSWLGWSFGGAVMSQDPAIVALGNGAVTAVIRDNWGGIWYRSLTEGTAGGWLAWVNAGGKLQSAAPAAVDGELYIAGANPAGDLCWYRSQGNQWTNLGYRGFTAGRVGAGPR